jgi:ABC-type dipeptide/oligopeptide/nickel transport system ATPase component
MKNILEVKNLSVRYLAQTQVVQALDRVSFDLEQGQILGVVGESGSGKSTLALSILGLLPQNATREGEIIFEGADLFSLTPEELRLLLGKKIGIVFQEPPASFNPILSIEYQFKEFLREKLRIKREEQLRDVIQDCFKKTGLREVARILKSYPHTLSGGQLQRVAIAMSISTNPRVLIADEPTSSLDVTIESQIINLFLKLREELNLSIVFITHNLDLIKVLCDRVCVLYQGRIKEIKDKEELFKNPSDDYTKELIEVFEKLQ